MYDRSKNNRSLRDFYKEINFLELKSRLSLRIMLVILLCVFLLLLAVLLSFKYNQNAGRISGADDFSWNIPRIGTKKEEVPSAPASPDVPKTITIQEASLAKSIDLSGPTFPLKNPSLKITTAGIAINGRTGESWFSLRVEVLVVPKAENGKLIFDIASVKAAGLSVPSKISDMLNQKIGAGFNDTNIIDQKLFVTDVKLLPGAMNITVQPKS